MYERFTNRARRVVILAQEAVPEDAELTTDYLLLGLALEGEGIAGQVLAGRGITPSAIKDAGLANVQRRGDEQMGRPARRALELSLREALKLGHSYIGTEHILLSILAGGFAAPAVLRRLGMDIDDIREDVLAKLRGYGTLSSDVGVPAVASVLVTSAPCEDCGSKDFESYRVPDVVWKRLSTGSSSLCWSCLMLRIH